MGRFPWDSHRTPIPVDKPVKLSFIYVYWYYQDAQKHHFLNRALLFVYINHKAVHLLVQICQ